MATAGSSLALAAIVALGALAGDAHAQRKGQAVPATAQFDKGRALMKEKKYAEACAAFEHSQELDPQNGTLYNLAICYSMSGKLASAWAAFRELSQRDANPTRKKDSARRAAALDKRLPHLVIKVPDAPAGLAVTLDGVDVTGLVGSDNPVDLGDHAIHATAPRRKDTDATAAIKDEGKTVTVTVTLPVIADAPVAATPKPREPVAVEPVERPAPARSEPPRSHRKLYGAIVGGAGVALVATGLVFGKRASDKWSEAKQLCGDDRMCDSEADLTAGNQLVKDARSQATLATAFAIGGGVAIAAGVVLIVTAPGREARPATAWRLTPSAGPGLVALRLDGRF